MVKKKLTPAALLCSLLIGLNACGYVIIGALTAGVGAGTYFYYQGNLKRDYEAPIEKMWEVTLQAVEELRLSTESTRSDAFAGEIKGMMADDTSFQIELRRLGNNWTEVGVRIGKFGDRTKSEAIHDMIMSKL